MKKGLFVVLDGPDGAGKDTNCSAIASYLEGIGADYVIVQDPSPEVASSIRQTILYTEGLENSTRLFLYLAARCELLNKQIKPALDEGKIVICNRYDLSTYCYQGEFFTKEQIDTVSKIGGLKDVIPDVQLVFLSEKSFRENEEDVMDDYCNAYRRNIIKRYTDYSKVPEFNINVIWTDKLGMEGSAEETLNILKQYFKGLQLKSCI